MGAIFEWLGSDGDVGQFQFRYPSPRTTVPGGEFDISMVPGNRNPADYTVQQKLALAAQWDAQDREWLMFQFRGHTETHRALVRCPVTKQFVVNRYFTTDSYDRDAFRLWAVDQVIRHGCSGPIRVDTPCPAGSTRVRTRQSPQGTCLTCAPPLRIVYDREGYATCARAPALTQVAPAAPRPVTPASYQAPLRTPSILYRPPMSMVRGAPAFEWLEAPGTLGQPITFEQGHTYLSRWLVENPWTGQPGAAPPGFPCDAGVDGLMQQIFAPDLWTSVVSKGFPPSGFQLPAGALPLPVPVGNECPVFTSSEWKLPTSDPRSTLPDPQALLALVASVVPGARLFDMWDTTTGQKLVQGSEPALDLCPDGQIRDAAGNCVAGSCGPGTIMNRRSECLPAGSGPGGTSPGGAGPGGGGTQPTAGAGKKSSAAPIIAGAEILLLIGGGIALAR